MVVVYPDFLPASCAKFARSVAFKCEKGVLTKSFVNLTALVIFSISLKSSLLLQI